MKIVLERMRKAMKKARKPKVDKFEKHQPMVKEVNAKDLLSGKTKGIDLSKYRIILYLYPLHP